MIPKSDLSGHTWYICLAFTIIQAAHMVLMVSSTCNLSVVCNIFTEIRKIGLFWKFPSSQFPVYCLMWKFFFSLLYLNVLQAVHMVLMDLKASSWRKFVILIFKFWKLIIFQKFPRLHDPEKRFEWSNLIYLISFYYSTGCTNDFIIVLTFRIDYF